MRLTPFQLVSGNLVKVEEEVVEFKDACWICEDFSLRKENQPSTHLTTHKAHIRHFEGQHKVLWPCLICNKPQASNSQRQVNIYAVKILCHAFWVVLATFTFRCLSDNQHHPHLQPYDQMYARIGNEFNLFGFS